MAVTTANNLEGSSVPPEMAQNLEMEEDYNKYTPSGDYNSTSGRNIFRNKKFTKKRHESKTRKTAEGQDPSSFFGSDEEYPQSPSSSKPTELYHRSIPRMMMSINQTIKKMTLKDTNSLKDIGGTGPVSASAANGKSVEAVGGAVVVSTETVPTVTEETKSDRSMYSCGNPDCGDNCMFADGGARLLAALEKADQEEDFEEDIETETNSRIEVDGENGAVTNKCLTVAVVNQGNCNNNTSCNPQSHPQGKRRRHRRKQQYKRMAVDVQSDKKCVKLKVPNSNSSEDSGIGKRKRNIILSDNNNCSAATADAILKAAASGVGIVPVPVNPVKSSGGGSGQTSKMNQQQWQLDHDSDAVMMDCDDLESSSNTRIAKTHSHITEESGESDTQNDDIESLSDHNQDADDEESDYYNNDSSTTSLSESSFTILNPSKKFIPVHSREIRSGRRRLKNTTFSSIENEELSKFLQSPVESVLKVCPSSEKERQDFKNVASLYSLSYEEGHDQEDQRMWVQFTKTSKTTTTTQQQRRNAEMIKAAAGDRSSFNTFSEGSSLAPLFDTLVQETVEAGENSDGCIVDRDGGAPGNSVGICVNQIVNSKRIKKGC